MFKLRVKKKRSKLISLKVSANSFFFSSVLYITLRVGKWMEERYLDEYTWWLPLLQWGERHTWKKGRKWHSKAMLPAQPRGWVFIVYIIIESSFIIVIIHYYYGISIYCYFWLTEHILWASRVYIYNLLQNRAWDGLYLMHATLHSATGMSLTSPAKGATWVPL